MREQEICSQFKIMLTSLDDDQRAYVSLIYFAPQTLNSSRVEMSILFCSECIKRFINVLSDWQDRLLQFLGQKGGPVIGFSATGQRIIAVFRAAGHDLLT